ncbi:MAG: lipoprotein signal peptidase [Prevotellaceae bacterium]|jgi:signal peptidase II|nr:lipoprotein signal peptidase [Prevotellaceae bacterium]
MKLTPGKITAIIIAAVVIFDQVIKIWIKTTMPLDREFPVLGNWFLVHFTENSGMAFGMKFGGDIGKLLLSLFRVVLVTLIGMMLVRLKRRATTPVGVMVGFALILAGAAGNIIDSMFYGLLFDSSINQVATFLPEGGGYAPFLFGNVVDMLYFPLIETTLPDWIPFWGGQDFVFFRPIFNVADTSISTGVIYLLLFQRKFFTAKNRRTTELQLE